jgi:hypothetical protein
MGDGEAPAAPQPAARRVAGPVNGQPGPILGDERLPAGVEGLEQAGPADERDGDYTPVGCERCGATVLVAKFSPQHTSVQWTGQAVRTCAEFSARVAAGEQTALIDTCASLRTSIDRAVTEGRLEVLPL